MKYKKEERFNDKSYACEEAVFFSWVDDAAAATLAAGGINNCARLRFGCISHMSIQ